MVPRVGFIPSQAGLLDVATLQTAVFAWVLARQLEGDLVQDQADSRFVAALNWLGIDWDEGVGVHPDFSSLLKTIPQQAYEAAVQQLRNKGIIDGPLDQISFKLPPTFSFVDIQGQEHAVALNKLSAADLTAVVTNHHHEITHVVVPADSLAVAASYAYLFEQLSWVAPKWLVLPQLRNAQSYLAHKFENDGYLPTAVFNFLLLLAWTPPNGQEILSKWEMREQFDWKQVAQTSRPFVEQALRRLNRHYLQRLSDGQLAQQIRPFLEDAYGYLSPTEAWMQQITAVIRPQLFTFEDAVEAAEWVFEDEVWIEDEAALQTPQARPILTRLVAEIARVVLLDEKTAVSILRSLYEANPNWSQAAIEAPIYAALVGSTKEPPIPKILGIIGKQRALTRLGSALHNAAPAM